MTSNTEKKPSLETLKANLDEANIRLKKAVRKARVPSDFKIQEDAAYRAYRAYWGAVDSSK